MAPVKAVTNGEAIKYGIHHIKTLLLMLVPAIVGSIIGGWIAFKSWEYPMDMVGVAIGGIILVIGVGITYAGFLGLFYKAISDAVAMGNEVVK